MGKTKDRAAQAAAAGQTRAAPGSPEAARAAAHLTPLLRRNEQATVLAAALTALGQLFANGTLNETDFAALEAPRAPTSNATCSPPSPKTSAPTPPAPSSPCAAATPPAPPSPPPCTPASNANRPAAPSPAKSAPACTPLQTAAKPRHKQNPRTVGQKAV